MSVSRVERTYHPGGAMASEVTYVDGKVNGVTKLWYANGQLESTVPVTNGMMNGVIMQWDSAGRLLGECEIHMGTGLYKEWYEDGTLKSETSLTEGVPNGRMRCWDEKGELITEQFFVAGRRVSRHQYSEGCDVDSSLPQYLPNDSTQGWADTDRERTVDLHMTSAADYPDACDASEWLKGSEASVRRTLGELSEQMSIELVRRFLNAGAERVLAIDVNREGDDENTGQVLVELPEERSARRRVLELANEMNKHAGYPGVNESGQRFLYVTLD